MGSGRRREVLTVADEIRVGVISDTHGLLRPEAVEALRGSALILHAGDVGDPAILEELEALAPVVTVRGNVDRGEWAQILPETQVVEVEGALLYMLHDVEALDLSPQAAGFQAVIFGHSHLPEIRQEKGVLFFNPGSAGHRRFSYPVTVGRIFVGEGAVRGEIVELD